MIIGFDLDDVVVNSETFIRNYILKKEGYDIGLNREEYLIKIPGHDNKYADDLVKEAYSHIEEAGPVKNALQTIKKIYELTNQKIIFITARHITGWIPGKVTLKKKTIDWLEEYISGSNKFQWDVVFSNGHPKSTVLPKEMKYFVEDVAYFANDLSKKLETVFLIDKAWNKYAMIESNVIRVKNIDIVYLFLKKTLKYQ